MKNISSGFYIFLITIFVFVLSSCKSDADNLPFEDGQQIELYAVKRQLVSEQLVALAVGRVFDGMEIKAQLPVTRLSTDEQPLIIKYAFDFVQINDAVRFTAQEIDFPFLKEICGYGEIEVFLTSFNTFVREYETKAAINHLQPFISDDLIVFRGEWGLYSCMSNSGSWQYNDMGNNISSLIEYSSHKRFGVNSIDKDFTPPLYQFFVKTENDVISLACSNSNGVGISPDKSLKWTVLNGGNTVSSDELFSTEELCEMPQTSQQCTITDIGGDYFMISGNSNLEKIYFDEYTLFFADEKPAKSTDFENGDLIAVTLDKLYERYNPKVTVANIIIKN